MVVKMQRGPTIFRDGLQMKWLVFKIESRGLILCFHFPRVQMKSETLVLLNHDEW